MGHSQIIGTGIFLPRNKTLTKFYIRSRTGIRTRAISSQKENHAYMAKHAIDQAIQNTNIKLEDCHLIVTTNTYNPEHLPSKASKIQAKAGLIENKTPCLDVVTDHSATLDFLVKALEGKKAAIVDEKGLLLTGNSCGYRLQSLADTCDHLSKAEPDLIISHNNEETLAHILAKDLGIGLSRHDQYAGCATSLIALGMASSYIETQGGHVIVAGVDRLTKYTDPQDEGTNDLFGDLAVALLLGPSEKPGIISTRTRTDSTGIELIKAEYAGNEQYFFRQQGQQVHGWALERIPELMEEILEEKQNAEKHHGKGRLYIAIHNASPRMILKALEPYSKHITGVCITGDETGNTSTAAAPHGIHEILMGKKIMPGTSIKGAYDIIKNDLPIAGFKQLLPIQTGDYIGGIAFGAGLTTTRILYRKP